MITFNRADLWPAAVPLRKSVSSVPTIAERETMTRREFFHKSLVASTGVAMATLSPQLWLNPLAAYAAEQERILVVIQLSGGNDGLNTVVPFKDAAYYAARPKLAIPASDVVKLNDEIGLNPALRSLESLFVDGRMSIVQGVGYEQPNRSHFESMDIWHSCQRKTDRGSFGWIGRWSSQEKAAVASPPTGSTTASAAMDSWALHLGHEPQPLALASRDGTIASIASLEQFRLRLGDRENLKRELLQLTRSTAAASESAASDLLNFVQASSQTAIETSQRLEGARQSTDANDFPKSPLGEKLSTIAQLIVSEFATRVYYVTLDGFDTHAQQPAAHSALLRQWAEALSAFHQRLNQAGQSDRALVLTFSEFGRRVAENASDGTDHGAAAPIFLSGPQLKSAIVGQQPSLTDLDDGDLKYHTDFRSVYATVIGKWFQSKADSRIVLGGEYPVLELGFTS